MHSERSARSAASAAPMKATVSRGALRVELALPRGGCAVISPLETLRAGAHTMETLLRCCDLTIRSITCGAAGGDSGTYATGRVPS